MNNATLAKAAGWLQFVAQALAQVATTGVPTNPLGWVALAASLATAVGMHAAAQTDGSK